MWQESVMQISISVMLKKDLGGNTDLMQVLLETMWQESVMQISISVMLKKDLGGNTDLMQVLLETMWQLETMLCRLVSVEYKYIRMLPEWINHRGPRFHQVNFKYSIFHSLLWGY